MLMELRDNVSNLDAQAYAELKSYKEPPKVVHQIIRAVLSIFHPAQAKNLEFENWDKCKKVKVKRQIKIMYYHVISIA